VVKSVKAPDFSDQLEAKAPPSKPAWSAQESGTTLFTNTGSGGNCRNDLQQLYHLFPGVKVLCSQFIQYPLVNIQKAIENGHL
jgi:hypothetical protein